MLSSRNLHACYPQNLNDDGKLHNGLTASLCSRTAPPQKHKLIAKRGQKQHSSNKADSTKCSKCDQHKCQREMSPTALVSVPAFVSAGTTLFSSFSDLHYLLKIVLCTDFQNELETHLMHRISGDVSFSVSYNWFWSGARWNLAKEVIMEDIYLVAWFIQHSPE